MTEIPDHLLQRTRSRRQALGLPVSDDGGAGDAGEGGAAPATPASGGGAVATTGASPPKGPVAPSGPLERPASTPEPVAPYVEASLRRRRIPVWAMPVVAVLPIWAFLYAGTLEPAPITDLSLRQEGAVVYSGAAGCAGCHGGTGGGGIGPAFVNGAAVNTFPDPVDHVRWIILGSAGGSEVYAAAGRQSVGGMPAFGETLTLAEIVGVVLHERQDLAGAEAEADAEAWAGLRELPGEFADLGYTDEEVTVILEEIAEQESVEIPEAE